MNLVDGRFRVAAVAGRGAFGAVYRAIDSASGREVALKLLARETTDFRRFEREAEVLATIRHPNVVSYVAHGLDAEAGAYLAMEWLDGVDLAVRIGKQPLSIRESLVIAARAAQGLAAAHAMGIIHRDVKPSNLYLVGGRPDDPRVIDFGIARVPATYTKLTATGMLIGTPAYMAPEQARGEADLSPRADVFALGCVLFECLTGSPPFEAPNARALLARILTGAAPRLSERRPDAPPILDALLARMLAHDPADRFADAGAAAMAVSAVMTEGTVSSALLGGPVVTSRAVRTESLLVVRPAPGEELADEVEGLVVESSGETRRCDATSLVAAFSAGAPAEGALRAARCAMALRNRDGSLRIGIVTVRGRTSAGSIEEVEQRVGATLDEVEAEQALLDAATASHLARHYEIERRGERVFLGPARTGSTDAGVALVGRARELAALEGTCAEVIEERCARVALLLGEAGIGKSRLLAEMLRRLPELAPDATVLAASGDRPTSTSPFAILAQIVRRRAGSDPAVARDRLRASGLGDVEADFLCELAGLGVGGGEAPPHLQAGRRDAMVMADAFRGAWLTFVDTELQRGPLLLAVEDLHWSDPASIRLVDAALEEFADRPLLVVATARPDEAASAIAIFDARDPERIALRPLRPNAAAELVRAVAGEVSPEGVSRVVARSDGNPLRLVELARLGGDATAESARGAIEARLARLDAFARRVLRAASVFGVRFPSEGLFALLGGEARRSDVEEGLQRAHGERFVAPLEGATSGDDAIWSFRHGLVQESAYATLEEEERRAAHATVGQWLAGRGGIDPSLVAWHFERAEMREHAHEHYEAAARVALRGRDLERALRLTEAAMSCHPAGEDLSRILLLRAQAAYHRGDATESKRAATLAMEAASPGGLEWTSAAGIAITAAGQRGDNADVSQLADAVMAQAARPDATALRAVCLGRAALQLFAVGQHARTRTLVREAESADATDPLARAWTRRVQAALLVLDHDYDAAIRTQTEALRCFVAAGDVRDACHARIQVAGVHTFAGDFDAAGRELDVAESMARRIGADYFLKWAAYTRGKGLALAGDPAAAREHLARVRRDLAGHPRIVAGTHVFGALAGLRAGDGAWAESEARAALAAHDVPATQTVGLAVLGRALVLCGRPAEALHASNEASRVLAAMGTVEENESVVHLAAVEAALACGREDEARDAAKRALDRLASIAAKLSLPARREAYLHGVEAHAQTLRLAFRLGLRVEGT
jgi:tetratricopeptide (TPR) repeat protein